MSSGDVARPGGQGATRGEAEQETLPAHAWAEQLLAQTRLRERDAQREPDVTRVLDALPSGWTALHDRRCPDAPLASIEHLVVGPGGVFVVSSTTWSGTATVADGVLLQDGQPREAVVADVADAVLPLAQLVAGLVGSDSGDVQPVLCISGAGALAGTSRDVLVCSADMLADQLLSRPQVLDATEADDLAFRLDLELHGVAPVRTERRLPRLLPALTPPHLLTAEPSRPAVAMAEPGREAPEERERRRAAIPMQPAAREDRSRRVLTQRQRERERSRRARRARRIANAVLLVVVLVTFGPAGSSALSQALSALAPAAVTPAPSAPALPTACPSLQGEPATCVIPATGSGDTP